MEQFLLYLFDFDGTLFDTLPSSEYVFLKSYEHLGININVKDVINWTREPIPNSYARIGAPQERFAEFMDYVEHYVNSQESVNLTEIYPDTYDTILDLKMAEADVGIVTSNNASHVRDVLKKFDMQTGFFDVIVGNREAPTPKPKPEPILKALELIKYHGDKKKVCYVGDSINDCLAAINAGIVPILLDRLDEYKESPYLRIKSLKELLD